MSARRAAALALLAGLVALVNGPAAATPPDKPDPAVDRCEAMARAQQKAWGHPSAAVAIDRDLDRLNIDRFEGKVGTQKVSTVYHGPLTIDDGDGPKPYRFVCLDGGEPKPGPVFFYVFPPAY